MILAKPKIKQKMQNAGIVDPMEIHTIFSMLMVGFLI